MKDLLHLDTSGTTNVFGTQPKIVTNNGNRFDCTVNFDRALKIQALELESAEIPNNFYNVQSPYNVVNYNVPAMAQMGGAPTVTGYTYIPFSNLPSSFTLTQTSTGNPWTYNTTKISDGGSYPTLTLIPSQPSDI
jgi:hypothetical protein